MRNILRLVSAKSEGFKLRECYLLIKNLILSCCVDDIAAEHAKCDSLIHFGEACLSAPSSRIPILYVFGQQPIDLDHFSTTLNSQLQDEEIKKYNEFVFLYEANIASCSSELFLNIIAQKLIFELLWIRRVTPGSKIEKKFFNFLKMAYLGVILCEKSIVRIPEALCLTLKN
jgi:diphthamide biosynthesis enzyme Dph1/Dph2-like protein